MGLDFGALWTDDDGNPTFERGAGLPGRVMERGTIEFVPDVRRDLDFIRASQAVEAGLRAAVAMSLRAQGDTFGVIEFFTREVTPAEGELLELMDTLAAQIARFFSIIAEREELRGRLERLALTGLPNRRAWDQGLDRELASARRQSEALCVAVLDLVPLDNAMVVVERLRAGTPKGLTCSAGLAAWDGKESAQQLVGRADAALYQAKDEGCDRAVVAPGAPL